AGLHRGMGEVSERGRRGPTSLVTEAPRDRTEAASRRAGDRIRGGTGGVAVNAILSSVDQAWVAAGARRDRSMFADGVLAGTTGTTCPFRIKNRHGRDGVIARGKLNRGLSELALQGYGACRSLTAGREPAGKLMMSPFGARPDSGGEYTSWSESRRSQCPGTETGPSVPGTCT